MGFLRDMMVAFGWPTRRPPPVTTPAGSTEAVDRSGQVIRCSARAVPGAPRYPTLAAMRGATETFGFVPAALLAQKSKAVADGVLGALEGVSTSGNAACMGIDAFLAALGARLAPGNPGRNVIEAALDLAAGDPSPRFAAPYFLMQPVRSKPLGFYTWSEDLVRVFHRDRFLQQELEDAEAEPLWQAIRSDGALRAGYVHHLHRIARLTNPFSRASLAGGGGSPLPVKRAVFPPSTAAENHYSSLAAFFEAVRAGTCNLDPAPAGGFYAHQIRAIDPLLRPDAFPEARARTIDAEYAAVLEHLAAANLFLARESHVKQLAIPAPVAVAQTATRWIHPSIKVEPLPSHYAFVSEAFRFLRTVVREGWGEEALAVAQRRASGPIATTLAEGIDEVIDLCDTAARLSLRELGGEIDGPDIEAWRARLSGLWTDPDATGDARGMVPLGFTPEGQLRVLVLGGWEVHRLVLSLEWLPRKPPDLGLGSASYPLPLPIVREMVIAPSAVLDREEVRRLCDEALASGDSSPPVHPGSAGSGIPRLMS
jgi:hypothetical protein